VKLDPPYTPRRLKDIAGRGKNLQRPIQTDLMIATEKEESDSDIEV